LKLQSCDSIETLAETESLFALDFPDTLSLFFSLRVRSLRGSLKFWNNLEFKFPTLSIEELSPRLRDCFIMKFGINARIKGASNVMLKIKIITRLRREADYYCYYHENLKF